MSNFSYEKVGQYSDEVVARVIKDKGIIQAIDKKKYEIDIGKKSNFAKFATLIKARKYQDAENFVRKNQFEVLSPQKRIKKFETLGWTQIEKTVFSSKEIKISTPEQEQITLLIIKNVLGDDSKTWKSFTELFNKGKDIKKIFPDLPKLNEWWEHFELQFNEIDGLSKFPNSSYDVYLYDGKGSFMDYITKFVTQDLDLYSKKDSWNPADIWLVKSNVIQKKYIENFDKIKENLDNNVYGKNEMKAVGELNGILKTAYKNRDICGISLKKSDRKTLKFSEFNLESTANTQKLPNVKFDKIEMDCAYDEKKGFLSKTSYFYVTDSTNKQSFKCAFKSNTGKGVGNITYEFLAADGAAAFLGKVPKDQLKIWLEKQIKSLNKDDAREMPQGSLLPEKFGKNEILIWQKKVNKIISTFGKFPHLDKLVTNLQKSYASFGLYTENSTMMQMVDFTYLLARLKDNKNLIKFVTMSYYFAQKKGQKYYFGPFGKLY
tara:strand:+ start:47 stop:1516 length:1470 start_codon:yes stop_codon:yes gene_type:complete